MSNNEEGVKMVKMAARQIEVLCPQVCVKQMCVGRVAWVLFSICSRLFHNCGPGLSVTQALNENRNINSQRCDVV